MSNDSLIRMKCYLCDGPIEFPPQLANQIIACPHCAREITLAVLSGLPAKPSPLPASHHEKRARAMREHSLGFNRLCVALGSAATLVACVIMLAQGLLEELSVHFRFNDSEACLALLRCAFIAGLVFVLGWGLPRLAYCMIYWIHEGFQKDEGTGSSQ